MVSIMKKYNGYLNLVSVALSIALGVALPHIFGSIHFIGELFIGLLKLFALPLICSALITALGEMGSNIGKLKSLARNAMGYMLVSELAAVGIALLLFNLFKPGAGLSPDLILQGSQYLSENSSSLSFSGFISSIFSHNIFESLSKFELLPVVSFSIMFGCACSQVNEKSKPIIEFFFAVREVSTACLHGVMAFAPIGIFVLVGTGVSQAYLAGSLQANFFALMGFLSVLLLGLLLHASWQLLVVVWLTKQRASSILKQSMPVFATAFGTSSSVATLPVAMETADVLQSNPAVTRFMLPLCASINIGGMMMYEIAAALFFSQMLGHELSLQQQLLVSLACILGGIAEGGIPETSMVSLVVVFKIVHVPLSAITILLPLDRILDRLRTVVNIFGNMCGVIVVSKITPSVYESGESGDVQCFKDAFLHSSDSSAGAKVALS
jgi:Na+/H+-dicarboxylate symporter